jgi:hypothetical protein
VRLLRKIVSKTLDALASYRIVLFLVAALLVYCGLRLFWGTPRPEDLVVEGYGFLYDIILFGVILSFYDWWREKRTKIRDYHEQLTDFLSWEGQEGMLRKVGIIRRLNEMRAPLPDMFNIVLTKADLSEVNLKNACMQKCDLSNAVLEYADLEGADVEEGNFVGCDFLGSNLKDTRLRFAILRGAKFEGANLEGADLWESRLQGADLGKARGVTWQQLEDTKRDDKTILPDYLKH